MSDSDLIAKTAALHRAAPREWEEFMVEMKSYAERSRDNLVRAPDSALKTVQGRAQEASLLTELFANAAKTADRISVRRT